MSAQVAFELPERLEAHTTPEERGLARDDVRMLVARGSDGRLTHARARDLPDFLRAGAVGYLLKDVEPQELVAAIRTVNDGETLLHPAVVRELVREVAGARRPPAADNPLTSREREVLGLIARGRANKAIAFGLGVAEKTVKTHVSNILAKLNVTDRTQAALYAVREGLVDADG